MWARDFRSLPVAARRVPPEDVRQDAGGWAYLKENLPSETAIPRGS
jgi:hypothetical protein